MTRYVLDSFAWIEEIRGTPLGNVVRQLIEDQDNETFTSAVTVSEVVSHAERKKLDGRKIADALEAGSTVVPMDFTLAVSTGLIHGERKRRTPDFSFGDAAVVALARLMRGRVVTGDAHFKDEPGVFFLR